MTQPPQVEFPSLTQTQDRRFLDPLLIAGKGGKVRKALREATAAERASAAVSLLEAGADLRSRATNWPPARQGSI